MTALSCRSLGDAFALVEIASQVSAAIDSSGKIAQDLEASKKELQSFLLIYNSVDRVLNSGVLIHKDDLATFEAVMKNCRECLDSFGKYLGRFENRRKIKKFARRLQYGLSEKEEIRCFEGRMRGFVAMLSIVQTRYCFQELATHIDRSLDEPWDQRPMRFQDAKGRRYPIPLEVCSTFEGFMNFLQFAFKADPAMHIAVQQQCIWLFTPCLSMLNTSFLIFESDWQTVSKPGAQLGMSFLEQEWQPLEMPLLRADDKTRSAEVMVINRETVEAVKFGTPMPAWSSYVLDTIFKLM